MKVLNEQIEIEIEIEKIHEELKNKENICVEKDNDKRQDIVKLFKENILSFEQFEKCLSVL